MGKKDPVLRSLITCVVLFIAAALSFVIFLTGNVCFHVEDFAVDSFGRVYISRTYKIDVYDDGEWSHSIPTPAMAKLRYFTIDSEDTFLLRLSGDIYKMDLQGNVISIDQNASERELEKLGEDNIFFVSASGDRYKLLNTLGYYRISKNDTEIVYSMPVFDYIVLLTLIGSWAGIIYNMLRYGDRWQERFRF